MITKDIFSNISPRNTLNDEREKNVSDDLSNSYIQNSLDNVVLNSNLDTNDYIK